MSDERPIYTCNYCGEAVIPSDRVSMWVCTAECYLRWFKSHLPKLGAGR